MLNSTRVAQNPARVLHRWLASPSGREELTGWLFISPWVIGFVLLTIGPMLYSLYLSFFDASLLSEPTFVGFKNYLTLLSTSETQSLFWRTLGNTSFYVFLSVPLGILLGLGLALLLNQEIYGRGLFRMIYYLPVVVPPVASALLWLWIFHRDFGLLNGALRIVGVAGPAWLTSSMWSKPALVLMSLWGLGGNMLIFLAGLQGIPTTLYEAAKVDGAGAWTCFWRITIPMMSPTIFFVLITGIIGSFQVFVSTAIITDGGPANSTLMYVLYLYRVAFQQFKMGFASALAWIYFVIMMLFTLLIFRSSSAWVFYEGNLLGGKE